MSTETTIPCPICGLPAEYEAPDTVHNGVGEVPVGPDSWVCDTHGHIWWNRDGVQHIQYPEAQADSGPRGVRSAEPAPQMFGLPDGGAE